MIDTKTLEDLAQRLTEALPEGAQNLRTDVERNFKAVLGSTFQRLDLVTRDEYEVQKLVLERTREKLKALEARLAALEGGEPANG